MSMACGSGACQQDGSRVLPEGLAPRAEPSRSSKMAFQAKGRRAKVQRQGRAAVFEEENGAPWCSWTSPPERGKHCIKGGWACRQKSDYAGFCRSWRGTLIMFFEAGALSRRNNMKYEPEVRSVILAMGKTLYYLVSVSASTKHLKKLL